jgi:sugar/nucleoside kinase (ribokinase family)
VGDDDFGRCILDRLNADGVRTDFVEVIKGRSTGVAFVNYSKDGSRTFIFHWDGTPAVMAAVPDASCVEGAKFLHIMGCSLMANEGFRERVFKTVELFFSKGAQISFDPNIRFELLKGRDLEEFAGPVLRRCSVLLPGEKELIMLGGQDDIHRAASELFTRYPLRTIVLKRGSKGCSVLTPSSRFDVPAFKIREVDPTGAGDCFDAGFICGLLEGRDLEQSALVASAVGAINAQAFGAMEGRISPLAVAEFLQRK